MSHHMTKKKRNPDRNFISEIDRFLTTFDKRHPERSASQEKDIEKYQVLIMQRDTKTNNP